MSSAYVHVQRKKEEELEADDKVITDIKIGRLDPGNSQKGQNNEEWESRPGGLWLKRSAKRYASDSAKVITAVDILFGADAVDPRPGWTTIDHALLLDVSGELQEARVSVRRGKPATPAKGEPRIGDNGKFKIMQLADIHFSTGTGHCREPEPAGFDGGKCEADTRTLNFIGRLLDEEKPDIVILSGDQVNGDTAPDAQSVGFFCSPIYLS